MDMESLQRIVKKLTNDIVDMKRNVGEGTSTKNFFKTPFKKTTPPTNKTTPPTEGINMEDFINMFKSLAFGGEASSDGKDEEEGEEETKKEDQSGDAEETFGQEVNSFWMFLTIYLEKMKMMILKKFIYLKILTILEVKD
jgi:hypothetical protein